MSTLVTGLIFLLLGVMALVFGLYSGQHATAAAGVVCLLFGREAMYFYAVLRREDKHRRLHRTKEKHPNE